MDERETAPRFWWLGRDERAVVKLLHIGQNPHAWQDPQ
jgi:hypothetical protein